MTPGPRTRPRALDQGSAREAIRLTQSRYLLARDNDDLRRVAATFTEDAILETVHNRYLGRRAILVALSGRLRPRAAGQRRSTSIFRRHMTTSSIEFDSESVAHVVSYFIAFNGSGVDHTGVYTDTYIQVGDQWLVSHRRVTVESVARNSRGLTRADMQARQLG
jgi:SnoaL-like domain